jgi:hypothetical protein
MPPWRPPGRLRRARRPARLLVAGGRPGGTARRHPRARRCARWRSSWSAATREAKVIVSSAPVRCTPRQTPQHWREGPANCRVRRAAGPRRIAAARPTSRSTASLDNTADSGAGSGTMGLTGDGHRRAREGRLAADVNLLSPRRPPACRCGTDDQLRPGRSRRGPASGQGQWFGVPAFLSSRSAMINTETSPE